METKHICTAMSGGVDSGAAAYLLTRGGYTVRGVTFDMNGDGVGDGARAICDRLGIPHETRDASETFARLVKRPFAEEYEKGRTPNPCVVCNRDVKFPLLASYADEYGIFEIATGHYARVGRCGDSVFIRRGADPDKDQSYMLWALPDSIISRLVFPLGGLTKTEVREIAANASLPCSHTPDSQDICFIPDGNTGAFLDSVLGAPAPGEFVAPDGTVLGTHRGQRYFTPGQSRGLGIALGHKAYVLSRDAASGRVVLGDDGDLYKKEVFAGDVLLRVPLTDAGARFSVKVRYTKKEASATVYPAPEGRIRVVFDEAVRAPAPGQSLVLYDGDALAGGGFIYA